MSEIGTRTHWDGRTMVRERVQDVEAILERNKRRQTEHQKAETFHHIAEIPCVFLERWFNEEYARGNVSLRMFTPEFDAIVKKKLQDSDWAWLRATDRKF